MGRTATEGVQKMDTSRWRSIALVGALGAAITVSATVLAAAPRVVSATISPSPVASGGTARIACTVADDDGAVKRITGVVREATTYKFTLARRPDGTWTTTVPIPRQTGPGTYHIDLQLIAADGRVLTPTPGGHPTIEVVVGGAGSPAPSPVPRSVAPKSESAATPEDSRFQTYMVPMRDGVRLATDVCLGAGPGPWPVILSRTPYGARRKGLGQGTDTYVVVAQDVRGRFDSEGDSLAFFDDGWGEHQDGLDTVKWIRAQPWCNGKVATVGGSAGAILENMLAGANPPGLAAQFIQVGAGSLYHNAAYPGGVLQERLVHGWLEGNRFAAHNLELMAAHPFYDELWQQVDSVARIKQERVNIPAVHVGGWFDVFTQGTLDSFIARSQIAPNQWLVMGPWPHGMKRDVGELVFPPNSVQVPNQMMSSARFFEHWLRGKDNGVDKTPRVTYYVMGACDEPGAPGNEWRTADSWPVTATATEFYLGANRELLPESPAAGSLKYDYDPARPVPTLGGGNLNLKAGPMDQSKLEGRADVLVFSTPPLEKPVEVTGRVMLRLYASSSAHDTTFMAKLCDVYPDGRSMLITDGALRAACRESLSSPSPLEPGKVYEFNIAIGSTSIIFNKGHRIRVDVSSSNYPRFAAHPNVWGEGKPQTATQTVYYGGTHASVVILPVVTTAR